MIKIIAFGRKYFTNVWVVLWIIILGILIGIACADIADSAIRIS